MVRQPDSLSFAEVSAMFNIPESQIRERFARKNAPQAFFSIQELADRWRCSRGTVRNRLRASGASMLDFAPGKRGKKAIAAGVVFQLENLKSKKLC
jgi:MarR-like DNA-binding transcriptional regulator SgrR of sgrS sRNA